MTETRRSLRLITRIPVSLTVGQDRAVRGMAVAVSRHGALVRSPVRYATGTLLTIQNESNLEVTACRVRWVGPDDLSEIHKLGIEFLDDAPISWGAVYEEWLALA